MAIDRSWSPAYLQKQKEAIRWLFKQGLTPEQIREMRWGAVDEADKLLRIRAKITSISADLDSFDLTRTEYEREFQIQLRNSECEWFFLKSKIPCAWMFTRERPKTWRREGSKESLYSLPQIKAICRSFYSVDPCKRFTSNSINLLTNTDNFANIEISKLNITKSKTKELGKKAMEVYRA